MVKTELAEIRRFSSLARPMHSSVYPGMTGGLGREYQMTTTFNNALAAVAAFTLTVLCMATAILPASPAGLLA